MKSVIKKIGKYKVLMTEEVPQSVYPPESGYWLQMVPTKRVDKALVLGLGGGTIARLILEKYPNTRIVGVDNNKEILSLARKNLGLKELGIKVVCKDAFEFIKETKDKFDLIVVDIWNGDWFPARVFSTKFVSSCKEALRDNGKIFINAPNLIDMATMSGFVSKTDIGINSIYKL